MPRYANNSSRVIGNPFCNSSGPSTPSRRYLSGTVTVASAVRQSRTTCRLSSFSVALPDELRLGPRLPLEVQNLLATVVDLDQRVTLIVLRDFLVGLKRNPELEQPGPGLGRLEPHLHRLRLAVAGQGHVLRGHHTAVVFDEQRDLHAGVAPLGDDDVDHERGALERAPRGLDAGNLKVARQPVPADRRCANTGIAWDFSPAIDSSSVRSALSDPSVASTNPATGSPLSS